MGTLNLATIRNLIRSDLNEYTEVMLTNAELNAIINDGYKDTAAKGLCSEKLITKSNIPTGVRLVPLSDDNVVRVNYVEFVSGTSGKGMVGILPQAMGYVPTSGSGGEPRYWFKWGNYLVIDPIPDTSTYGLNIYAACIPNAAMSAEADTPSQLPDEFHECVYLFSLAFAAFKLKRWADAGIAYNKYIMDVQRKRYDYVMKIPDAKLLRELPDSVTLEVQGER